MDSKYMTLIMFAAISALVLVLVLTVTRQQNVAADGDFEVAVEIDHHPRVHMGHPHDGPPHHTNNPNGEQQSIAKDTGFNVDVHHDYDVSIGPPIDLGHH